MSQSPEQSPLGHNAREVFARGRVQRARDRLAAVVDQLAGAGEAALIEEHTDYLQHRAGYLQGAMQDYLTRRDEPNHWEKVDMGNIAWQIGASKGALSALYKKQNSVLQHVYNESIRILDAINNPALLDSATAVISDIHQHSRPETAKQFRLLDQLYLVGNEDILKRETPEARLRAQLVTPIAIRRAKWELLLAVADAGSDMGLVHNSATSEPDESLLKTVANYFLDLSLQERGSANEHVPAGYRMYINTAYHSLRAAVMSGRIDHEAANLFAEEFDKGEHTGISRDSGIALLHTLRQERQLGILFHDGGEGRGELSTARTYAGMTQEEEQAMRQGKADVEHTIFNSHLEQARPAGIDPAQWHGIRNRIHHAYDVAEDTSGFEGRRCKVVERMESQRTHIYINQSRFLRSERPRPYTHADQHEKQMMLNYVTLPLYDVEVFAHGRVDYSRPHGPNALGNKVTPEHVDSLKHAVEEASLHAVEREYMHLQEHIHKAIAKGAPPWSGSGGRSR